MRALIVNRMHPRFSDAVTRVAARAGPTAWPAPTSASLYANLADFPQVAADEEEHVCAVWPSGSAPAPVVRVPFLRTDVHDLDGLAEIGRHLFAALTRAWSACQFSTVDVGRIEQRALGVGHRLGHRHDAIEAGGVQQAGEGRSAAGHRHVAFGLAGAADAADERAEPGRVHERHLGEVDEQPRLAGQLDERLAELADRVRVELADRPAQRVGTDFFDVDLEHGTSK